MQSFEWVDARSVEQAATLLAEGDTNKSVVAKAGGMDLLDLMKEGIISPARVVNLKSIKGLDEIRFSEAEGLDLGTLVTLSRMANAPEVRQRYAALADAARHVPPLAAGTRAAYHKQTERESYDWPICDVAVVLQMEGRRVRAAAVVMGWIAPTPRRAVESERVLTGRDLREDLVREAARVAVAGATPLSRNAYKVPVLEAVVRRTILAAATA